MARTAWITGGGRGIGAGVAEALVADGWQVWLTSRSAADCAATAQRLGPAAHSAPADVTDPAAVQAVAARIAAAGGLDALICSAGVGSFGPLAQFPPDELDRLLAVNVRGTLLCTQAALERMRPARSGAIIGIASVMAVTGYRNQGAYAASKHAMLGLLRVLAKEVQPDGVRVSCICPGAVDTAMVRASRPDLGPDDAMGVEDVAAAVRYLLSLSPRCAVDVLHLRRRAAEPFAV
jgi:NAD(P)-dependent dehydrogenase (short-subunit alcohol dehydrogenase family)